MSCEYKEFINQNQTKTLMQRNISVMGGVLSLRVENDHSSLFPK
jgi:hypothetical protein